MITVKVKGNLYRTKGFLKKMNEKRFLKDLEKYGQLGVDALTVATPKDSGETARSWSYEIRDGDGVTAIYWKNSNFNEGVPIAVILQYGHATGNGGYVEGVDYINPAMRLVFDQIAADAWAEVINS